MPPLLSENKPNAAHQQLVSLDGLALSPEREAELALLERKINYRFSNRLLLEKSLIHPSATRQRGNVSINNERMEFLGDAVLNLAVSDHLMMTTESFDEGNLSSIRASVVNKTALYELAKTLDLPRIIVVGDNERNKKINHNPSVLADACEALFAAVYIDGGYETAAKVIIDLVKEVIREIVTNPKTDNFKGFLQQWAQKKYQLLPEYKLDAESGPCHRKTYYVSCWIRGEKYGEGEGLCKKEAEQVAAQKTIEMLKLPNG